MGCFIFSYFVHTGQNDDWFGNQMLVYKTFFKVIIRSCPIREESQTGIKALLHAITSFSSEAEPTNTASHKQCRDNCNSKNPCVVSVHHRGYFRSRK